MKRKLSLLLSAALLCSCLSVPATAYEVSSEQVDTWAVEPVKRAEKKKLLPECLEGISLKEDITRAQFAAICVKLYETMSKETAVLPEKNPFQDTSDPYVLKAYELEVVSGVTENIFGGDLPLTREQAAVMLTSVYKAQRVRTKGAYYLMWLAHQYGSPGSGNILSGTAGGSDQTNSDIKDNYGAIPYAAYNTVSGVYQKLYGSLDTRGAEFFVDHSDISQWAIDSVYFMETSGIIKGMGNRQFKPQSNIQSQAALTMAVQLLEKLG